MQEKNSLSSTSQYATIFKGLPEDFNFRAIDLFRRQYMENSLYREFADCFIASPQEVRNISQIPYLPVAFFKSHAVKTGTFDADLIFNSSGTTGEITSRHFVKDLSLYRESFIKGFTIFYGDPCGYCIIGLLPAYLERAGPGAL